MKRATLFFCSILLLFGSFIVAQESSQESSASTEPSDLTDLSELAGTPEFFPELRQRYTSMSEPEAAVHLIRTYLPIVQSGDQRHRLLLDMARLEEQQHKLQSAQLHYQSAAFAPSGAPDFQALFMSALLLIEFADYDQALLQCRHVLRESSTTHLQLQARLQEARILHLQEEHAEAIESLELLYTERKNLSVEILYGMYSLYTLIAADSPAESTRAAEISRLIEQQYPESPENSLLQKKIRRSPTPETALGIATTETITKATDRTEEADKAAEAAESDEIVSDTESPDPEPKSRAIQTGSFRDAENAHYMQQELEKQGFTAMVAQAVVNGTTFFRVLVPIAYGQTEQQIVLQLKEKGFEGYPVY